MSTQVQGSGFRGQDSGGFEKHSKPDSQNLIADANAVPYLKSNGPPTVADLHPDQAEAVVVLIQRASQLLRGALTAHLAEFGLNDVRFSTLRIVAGAESRGCTQTHLAQQLRQSESSVSTLVERMRADSLLYRLRSKTDRRKRVLMLTDRGRLLMNQAESCHAKRVSQLLTSLDASQTRSLVLLLELLIDGVSGSQASAEKRSAQIAGPHFAVKNRSEPPPDAMDRLADEPTEGVVAS